MDMEPVYSSHVFLLLNSTEILHTTYVHIYMCMYVAIFLFICMFRVGSIKTSHTTQFLETSSVIFYGPAVVPPPRNFPYLVLLSCGKFLAVKFWQQLANVHY